MSADILGPSVPGINDALNIGFGQYRPALHALGGFKVPKSYSCSLPIQTHSPIQQLMIRETRATTSTFVSNR